MEEGETPVQVRVVRLPGTDDLPLPSYQTSGAAGMDLLAALDAPLILQPGERAAVPTGLAIGIPPGYEGQVRPRSGLAKNYGVTVTNAPGTIDSDYTGPLMVLLVNLGQEPYTLHRGERIAQLVIAPVVQAVWQPVDSLQETQRGGGGFGHTGR
jgi:dUTP pyrophosphatase